MKLEPINKEEFDKLPKNEKIVVICKDVLARLDAELIIPQSGSFWDDFSDIQEVFDSPKECFNEKPCEVCAKGAIFSSWVGNFNNIDWTEAVGVTENVKTMPRDLVKIFGKTLLDKIEVAFEGRKYRRTPSVSLKYAFLYDDKSYKESLQAIMENIIENNGDFVINEK
jgi:hypothetical protein